MAEYITVTDALVTLNGTIPYSNVSIPCGTGNVVPLAVGILNLKGNTPNRFARYRVSVKANIQIPEGGDITLIAVGIVINGAVIPESVAIVTPVATEEYSFINTNATITIPRGCCASVSAIYTDGTEDDATVTPTPSIKVRRNSTIDVERIA